MYLHSLLETISLALLAGSMLLASLLAIGNSHRALSIRRRSRKELALADELAIEARLRNW